MLTPITHINRVLSPQVFNFWPFTRKATPEKAKPERARKRPERGRKRPAYYVPQGHGFYNTKSGRYACGECDATPPTPGALRAHWHYYHSPGHAEKLAKKQRYNSTYKSRKAASDAERNALLTKYMDGTASEEERALFDARLRIEALKWLGEIFK